MLQAGCTPMQNTQKFNTQVHWREKIIKSNSGVSGGQIKPLAGRKQSPSSGLGGQVTLMALGRLCRDPSLDGHTDLGLAGCQRKGGCALCWVETSILASPSSQNLSLHAPRDKEKGKNLSQSPSHLGLISLKRIL